MIKTISPGHIYMYGQQYLSDVDTQTIIETKRYIELLKSYYIPGLEPECLVESLNHITNELLARNTIKGDTY